jgi:endonuclease/exonuclease/phosphatase family metal-dependent hydrolase
MKIVTLNTWGRGGPFEKRWEVLLNELSKFDPEIICLQEVFDGELTKRIKKRLNLKHALTSVPSGLAIVTKFDVLTEKTIAYKTQSPTETEPRRAIAAILKIGEKIIQVANTHLAWKPEDEAVRIGQTKELIECAQKEKEMTILAGDFNDVPESNSVSELKHAGFQDVYEQLHPNGTDLTWDNQNPYIQTHKEKFQDRRIDFLFFDKKLLNELHLKKRAGDLELEGQIKSMETAFRMQSEAMETFDISREPEAVRKAYGQTPFARSCLLARRLVEKGVRFVTVYYVSNDNQPWDTHDNHDERHRKLCLDGDQAAAALIADLKQRGMLEDTLVIWGGEFGRTPYSEIR